MKDDCKSSIYRRKLATLGMQIYYITEQERDTLAIMTKEMYIVVLMV